MPTIVPKLTESEYQDRQRFLHEYSTNYQIGLKLATEKIIKTGSSTSLSQSWKEKKEIASALLKNIEDNKFNSLPLPSINKLGTEFKANLENALCSAIFLIDGNECNTYSQIYANGVDLDSTTQLESVKLSNIAQMSYVDIPRLLNIAFCFSVSVRDSIVSNCGNSNVDLLSFLPSLSAALITACLAVYDLATMEISNNYIPVLKVMIKYVDGQDQQGISKDELIKLIRADQVNNLTEDKIVNLIQDLVRMRVLRPVEKDDQIFYLLKEKISYKKEK